MISSATKLVSFMAPLLLVLFSAHVQEAAAMSSNGSSANGIESTPATYNASSLNSSDDASAAALSGRSLASTQGVLISLDSYGAHGDGKHDDTQALAKAWDAACSSSRPAVLLVPKGKSYLLKFLTLSGPCKSSIVFMQLMNFFTYKAVRTVLNQLYEMNPPGYRWFYNFIAVNKPTDGKLFLPALGKERQELAERVMITRLHLYGTWIKKCDHTKMYEKISDENLALMQERLMETIVWPTDDTIRENQLMPACLAETLVVVHSFEFLNLAHFR